MVAKSNNRHDLSGKLEGQYLTSREAECMSLFARGHTMRTAAEEMGISIRTVESYLANVKERLEIHSKSAVITALYNSGFWA